MAEFTGKEIEKVEKLEKRAEEFEERIFGIFKNLKSAVGKRKVKRAKKYQRWVGLYEKREWRSYKRLISRLNKLRTKIPAEDQEILDSIESELSINEKILSEELSRKAGLVKKHLDDAKKYEKLNVKLADEAWASLDEEMNRIGTMISGIETIFRDKLEPELLKLEKLTAKGMTERERQNMKRRRFLSELALLEDLVKSNEADEVYYGIKEITAKIDKTTMNRRLIEKLIAFMSREEKIHEILQRITGFYIENKKFFDRFIRRYRPAEAADLIKVMTSISKMYQHRLLSFSPDIFKSEEKQLADLEKYHLNHFKKLRKVGGDVINKIVGAFGKAGKFIPQRVAPLTKLILILALGFSIVSNVEAGGVTRRAAANAARVARIQKSVISVKGEGSKLSTSHPREDIKNVEDFYNALLNIRHKKNQFPRRIKLKKGKSINPKKFLKEIEVMISAIENVDYREEQEDIYRVYIKRLEEIMQIVRVVGLDIGFRMPIGFPEKPPMPKKITELIPTKLPPPEGLKVIDQKAFIKDHKDFLKEEVIRYEREMRKKAQGFVGRKRPKLGRTTKSTGKMKARVTRSV